MAATLSPCGRYRYTLHREWMLGEGICLFVMLNPSTADASEDDPTIRRCIGFAQRWGYRELTVANLFALRSTDPEQLVDHPDPVGPDNDQWVERLATAADLCMVAWGAHPEAEKRAAAALERIRACAMEPHCLGITQEGHPRHPLYVKGTAEPVAYDPMERAA
jgi:hypothetical protein